MPNLAPFVVYFRVVPYRNKRREQLLDLQRMARLIYGGLSTLDSININVPGGGNESGIVGSSGSGLSYGLAFKVQIGQQPAQIMAAGFYHSSNTKSQVYPDINQIDAQGLKSGDGGQPWFSNPNSNVSDDVKALKAILEASVAASAPNDTITVYRIEYRGVVWGDGGYHFPL